MIPPRDFTTKLIRQEKRTEDVYSFYFEKKDFTFDPGQYIRLTLPSVKNDPRGTSRSFSVSSAPYEESIMVTMKISQSVFKQTMLSLAPGDEVSLFGPIGRMVLDETITTPLIFLAGGIGITPFHSMILYANKQKLPHKITFIVSFSTPEEIIYYDELTQIATENNNITVVYTITHPESSKVQWKGQTGRISSEMILKYAPDAKESKFYMAGPPAMVEAMLLITQEFGIDPKSVLKENFVGY